MACRQVYQIPCRLLEHAGVLLRVENRADNPCHLLREDILVCRDLRPRDDAWHRVLPGAGDPGKLLTRARRGEQLHRRLVGHRLSLDHAVEVLHVLLADGRQGLIAYEAVDHGGEVVLRTLLLRQLPDLAQALHDVVVLPEDLLLREGLSELHQAVSFDDHPGCLGPGRPEELPLLLGDSLDLDVELGDPPFHGAGLRPCIPPLPEPLSRVCPPAHEAVPVGNGALRLDDALCRLFRGLVQGDLFGGGEAVGL